MNPNETQIILFVRDICHTSLRWYFGLSLANYFIYCQFFFDWFVSLCLIDYISHLAINYLYQLFFPEELKSNFFEFVCLKFISLWLTSALLGQPLFVMLFSYTLYWVYAFYARLFAKLPIESFSMSYYFSSFLFLIPVSINFLVSILVFFNLDFRYSKLELVLTNLGLTSLFLDWGLVIFRESHPQLEEVKILKPYIPQKIRGLNSYQQEHFKYLQKRYFTRHDKLIILENLKDLKYHIRQLYDEKPACMGAQKLPLDWEEFLKFRLKLSTRQQVEGFKTYYQHPIHGAWRLLSEKNQWCSPKKKFQQRHLEFFKAENIEFVVLMWFLLNQSGVVEKNSQLQLKQQKFIYLLAKFNRLENRYVENTADCPARFDLLNQKLWNLVIEYPKNCAYLHNELEVFLISFIQKKWINLLMQMNSQVFHALCDKWEALFKAEGDVVQYQLELKQFDIQESDYQEFSKKMGIMYHDCWKTEPMLSLVENKFAIDPIYSQAYLNANLFSQALRQVKTRTQGLESLLLNFSY